MCYLATHKNKIFCHDGVSICGHEILAMETTDKSVYSVPFIQNIVLMWFLYIVFYILPDNKLYMSRNCVFLVIIISLVPDP